MINDTPEFALRLNGSLWTGWEEINIVRALDRMAGEFQLRLTSDASDFTLPPMVPGSKAEVEIDGRPVLVGYVDTIKANTADELHDLALTGRDKTGDLIDCAAAVDGGFEMNGLRLDAALRRVLKPYDIPLTVAADIGGTFARLAIQPGETAYDFIERACRARGLMPISDGIGGLVIVKPATERSMGQLIRGENILSVNIDIDVTEMHSLYVVKGQAEAVSGTADAEATAGGEGRVTDSRVTRYRPKVVIGENQGYDQTLKERAEWEKKIAAARSKRATYQVQGWYADVASKSLWKPNTLVHVQDIPSGLNRQMLIVGVSFTRGEQGTRTMLDLTMPEAFDIAAERVAAANEAAGSATDLWAEDGDE